MGRPRNEHKTVDGIELKHCNKCQQWLPLDHFSKDCSTWDSLRWYCRICFNITQGYKPRGTPYRPSPPHQVVGGVELKQCRKCSQWLPLGDFHQHSKGWGNTADGLQPWCNQCATQEAQIWRQGNPEKVTAARHRRRARALDAEGSFTAAEFIALCEHYNNRCVCCGAEGSLTPDHVVPLSRGGSNDISNIQPLCGQCNSTKGIKIIDYRKGHKVVS